MIRRISVGVVWLSAWILAAAASAQTITGTIAGTVRDTTGAVLPGVTVEASSPALIEKVRSVAADARGEYKIIDLRPGTYTVTFTLAGFSTVKREGIDLSAGFTSTVNADMKVGSLEETITVTGASPVVDVQNVRSQSVLSRETLDALPTAKQLQSYAALTLGAQLSNAQYQDVGGNQGDKVGVGGFIVHNNRNSDGRTMMDGMTIGPLAGENSSQNSSFFVNSLTIQETTVLTGGGNAEVQLAGVLINIVPKEGGNRFSGGFLLNGTGSTLQSNNLTSELTARGIATPPNVKRIYDVGGAIGGPIVRDRLWFFHSDRWWDTQNTEPGLYFDASPHRTTNVVFTPDLSRPKYVDYPHRDNQIRVTWQASAKNKLRIAATNQFSCNCFYTNVGQINAPEATTDLHWSPSWLTQAGWSYPATNRLLFEAGNTTLVQTQDNLRTAGVGPTDIPMTELSTGLNYNARALSVTGPTDYGLGTKKNQSNQRAAMSYVTGSHAFKAGLFVQEGWAQSNVELNEVPGLGPVNLRFLNGVPNSLTEFASPEYVAFNLMPDLGIYAQDQWTHRRVTLNLGLRYDHVRQLAPAITEPAIPAFAIPERSFPRVADVPRFNDLSPRFGAAWDVFGNGKTAIKASFGRYVLSQVSTLGSNNAPAARIALSVTRTWTDRNGNVFPECNLADPLANGECGQISNLNFGRPIPSTTYDPEILTGWMARPYVWQDSVLWQQELRPGMALNVGYFNTWYGNFTVTANQAVTPANFSPYCVTAPTDARLGAASGQQVCGFFDTNVAQFGLVNNLAQAASNFGSQREHFNGIDIGLNQRFGKGGLLQGGISTGQTVTDSCGVVTDNPQIALTVNGGAAPRTRAFCDVVLPWSAQTQYKLAANYPLPWYGVQVSGTYQNLPGIPIAAANTYTNAQIAPSLGRNLSSGSNGTATLQLIVPNTQFEDRINQADIRISKVFRMGRSRLTGNFDIYNVFNASPILQDNFSYGSSFLKPLAILGARLYKFGGQLDF